MLERCSCAEWCVTYPPQPGEFHHRDCPRWHRRVYGEVFVTKTELIVTGDPGDDDGHNCDAMGCTSVSHVLYRLPTPCGVSGKDYQTFCPSPTDGKDGP